MDLPTKLVGPVDRQTRVYDFENFPWIKQDGPIGHLRGDCRGKMIEGILRKQGIRREQIPDIWPCPECVKLPELEQPPQFAVPTGPYSGTLGSLLRARLARLASWVAHQS